MTKLLVTSDLHTTSKSADAYRFKIFPWLKRQAAQHNVDAVLILGDLTDEKDRHNAALVDKVVSCITDIAAQTPVYLLRGNHDCIDPDTPFFGFLDGFPNIYFFKHPAVMGIEGSQTFFIPHQREWTYPKPKFLDPCTYIFMHQTFDGAVGSNGYKLDGVDAHKFKHRADQLFISGDIHVPQKIGPVIYVGSPYHVRFGDGFTPRVLLIDGVRTQDLTFPAPKKLTLTVTRPDQLRTADGVSRGDFAKVRLSLPKSAFVDWQKYKREVVDICDDLGLELFGVELQERERVQSEMTKARAALRTVAAHGDLKRIVCGYCRAEGVDQNIQNTGLEIIRSAYIK